MIDAVADDGVELSLIRVVDRNLLPGVLSDQGPDDGRPAIKDEMLDAEILISATPTWVGQPSTITSRLSGGWTPRSPRPTTTVDRSRFDHVAGFVVIGNEDRAHHVIAELTQVVTDVGFTVARPGLRLLERGPGAWTGLLRNRSWPGVLGRGRPGRTRPTS